MVFLLAFLLRGKPLLADVPSGYFRDLGNLMLAFTMLWGYMSLSQYLITYSGNMSEEITWYVTRLHGGGQKTESRQRTDDLSSLLCSLSVLSVSSCSNHCFFLPSEFVIGTGGRLLARMPRRALKRQHSLFTLASVNPAVLEVRSG